MGAPFQANSALGTTTARSVAVAGGLGDAIIDGFPRLTDVIGAKMGGWATPDIQCSQ